LKNHTNRNDSEKSELESKHFRGIRKLNQNIPENQNLNQNYSEKLECKSEHLKKSKLKPEQF